MTIMQAPEFVVEAEKDGLEGLVGQAARGCPGCTLGILVEGLEHHLTSRTRREYNVLR